MYADDIPPYLVALRRVYEGSSTLHRVRLANNKVKVGVDEVRDVDACILIHTEEVLLVGQAMNTFIAYLKHL